MRPNLAVVQSGQLPDPPYSESVQVNGYKPWVDWQRIKSSKTWRLCPSDQKNNLLRVWLDCWNEVPAGSWENDSELIAAAIDVPPRIFEAHRDILMRGWVLHSDGRLYHPVITTMVQGMVDMRTGYAERARRARDKKKQELESKNAKNVTRDNADVTRESHESHAQDWTGLDVREEPANAGRLKVVETTSTPPARNPCPYKQIRDLWCETFPDLKHPLDPQYWTDARKATMRARWNNELPDMEAWKTCFNIVRRSKFLTGKAPTNNGRKPFSADLFWVIAPSNLLKIYEGNYEDA